MTREEAGEYFRDQLRKYRQIDCYWRDGRLITRCVIARLKFPVPPGSHFIGRYAYPFSGTAFLSDLDDALVKLAHDVHPPVV